MTNEIIAQQGWQCPICKRVYSPQTMMCFYCGGECKTTTTTAFETPCCEKEAKRYEDNSNN